MPLLDHFHPPLSERRAWEGFHTAWLSYISEALNRVLPAGYFAEEEGHAGANVEIDVATFHSPDPAEAAAAPEWAAGGVGVAAAPWVVPAAAATVPVAFADDFEVRVIAERGGRRLVAAVELVSPANKDRPETRRAFATKCASYLHQGVGVVVVDVVTDRHADLHDEIVSRLGSPGAARLPGGGRLAAVAYRPIRRDERDEIDIWPEPLAVGRPLPTLPLWLDAVTYARLDLDATYADTCRRRRIAG